MALGSSLSSTTAQPSPSLAAESAVLREAQTTFQDVVVKPGDTLWGISHAYLKDPARWDEILKYNKLPTQDPTVALPGMTLRVPIKLIKTSLRAAHGHDADVPEVPVPAVVGDDQGRPPGRQEVPVLADRQDRANLFTGHIIHFAHRENSTDFFGQL